MELIRIIRETGIIIMQMLMVLEVFLFINSTKKNTNLMAGIARGIVY